jgi:hypothetical protein
VERELNEIEKRVLVFESEYTRHVDNPLKRIVDEHIKDRNKKSGDEKL